MIKLSIILGKKLILEKIFRKLKSIEKKNILGGMANISFVGLIAEEIKKKIKEKKILGQLDRQIFF